MHENKRLSHSVPVPRIYKLSAKIAKQVKEEGGNIKQLVYQANHRNLKGLYSLVVKTLQYANPLDYLIDKTELLRKEQQFEPWLARVLIAELLWGKKHISGDSKPVQTVLKYQNEFPPLLDRINDELELITSRKVTKPRYVRVNTLVMSTAEAIDGFRNEGWTFIRNNCNTYEGYLQLVGGLQEGQFTTDIHVLDLLVFAPGSAFYAHQCYLDGSIFLQDKASCIPPILLNPTRNSTILDMCAAPGMKTTQLAAIINNEGTIYAVEKDQVRTKSLEEMVQLSGAGCVKVINRDVTTMDTREFPNVDYILVDPSCSGSGIVDRFDFVNNERDAARLEKLGGFQITILKHALTNFPDAKRVVYSTCSLYSEENEHVIEKIGRICPNYKLIDAKQLLDNKWINTGSADFKNVGEKCLYAKPDVDFTNGFFVAVFERLTESEIEEKKKNRPESEAKFKTPKEKKFKDKHRMTMNGDCLENDLEKSEKSNEVEQASIEQLSETCVSKKKKKKKKDNKLSENECELENIEDSLKRKKRKQSKEDQNDENVENIKESSKRKKRKERLNEDVEEKKDEESKKKKLKENDRSAEPVEITSEISGENTERTKKKMHIDDDNLGLEKIGVDGKELGVSSKSKKSKKIFEYTEMVKNNVSEDSFVTIKKDKKSKKKSKKDCESEVNIETGRYYNDFSESREKIKKSKKNKTEENEATDDFDAVSKKKKKKRHVEIETFGSGQEATEICADKPDKKRINHC